MLDWSEDEEAVVKAMTRFHVHSGMCAALARALKPLALTRFGDARGIRLSPEEGALYLVPQDSTRLPHWRAHLYLESQRHAVDAVTGPRGHSADSYRADHWRYAESLVVCEVDPEEVDVGIQQEDAS